MTLGAESFGFGNVVFILIFLGGLGAFAMSARRLIEMFSLGKPDGRLDDIPQRVKNTLEIAFAQKKLLRQPVAGVMHAVIFWGFCVLTVGTTEIILQGIHPTLNFQFLGALFTPLVFLQDLFAFLVLCAIAFAFYRRYVIKPKRLEVSQAAKRDATMILLAIATLMFSYFGTTTAEAAAGHARVGRFLSNPLAAALLGDASEGTLSTLFAVSWWTHIVLVLGFLNYLPYSKHFHVLGSIPNVFLSGTKHKGRLLPMDLEDETAEQFGAKDIEDLSWKQLLDGYTCTECGRCHEVCPAQTTGKPLSPRKIVTDVRHRLEERGPSLVALAKAAAAAKAAGKEPEPVEESETRLIGGSYISEEELWACTSCRACEQECPVMIEHVSTIVELRRYLSLTEGNMPAEAIVACKNMETNYTPWSMSHATRADWAKEQDVPLMADQSGSVDVLFWVGCAGSYDDRAKHISRSMVDILNEAGLSYGILGTEEKCTGDSARRLGNEYLFQSLAAENIETLNKYEFKRIVTACPHCMNTIGNEYPEFGGTYQVVHHTQFIKELVDSGRIKLPNAKNGKKITFHDPCYLGRYNEVYEEPRELMKVANNGPVTEMDRSRSRSFCCGAGGGRMWMEEDIDQRVNVNRTKEALETGAEVIGTGCPFCMTMMTDGVKAEGKQDDVEVLDVAEQVRQAMSRD